jgi:hypothetical protein
MLSYLSYFAVNPTSYAIMNKANVYNLLIKIYDMLPDDGTNKIDFVKEIKLICGLSFYDEFTKYVFRKDPNNMLLRMK